VFKVEKILKGSLDWIPSPSRIHENLISFLQKIAGRCQQTFLPLHHGKRKHNDGLYVLTHKTVFENQNRNSSYLAMFIS
jgi:hypothetical protein